MSGADMYVLFHGNGKTRRRGDVGQNLEIINERTLRCATPVAQSRRLAECLLISVLSLAK